MTGIPQLESSYLERSYESYLLHWLGQLDAHCSRRSIQYAFFGGAAVSAYVGHLVRKLHDLDVLVSPSKMQELGAFLVANGFERRESVKVAKAGFTKYSRRDHLYEVIVSVFPDRFTLLDVDNEDLPVLGVFDFRRALERLERWRVRGVGDGREVEINVVPFEDLVISKLWPTFEPATVHDLLLLFATDRAETIDCTYLAERAQASATFRQLILRTFELFEAKYRATAWYMLSADRDACTKTIDLLRSHLFASVTGEKDS